MIEASWQPPEGFEALDSSVEGVTVYAPAPDDAGDAQRGPRTVKCSSCGASIAFNVSEGALSCDYCGHVEQVQAQHVGHGATRHEFTHAALSAGRQGWGIERKTLHCESCGGDVSVSSGDLAAACTFCGSNHVNLREAQAQLRPATLIPFKIERDQLTDKVQTWLGEGWKHPDMLKKAASLELFRGIYLPFWVFSARMDSTWEAEVGYQETESYYDSDSGSYKTRTVIKYKWESGVAVVPVQNLPVPGTEAISARLIKRIEGYDFSGLVDYQPDFLSGWQASLYDITLPDAWTAGRRRMREMARKACRARIHSSHVRNFSMSADMEEETWRYTLLPVYVAAYQFRGRSWVVLVNGQNGEVAGQKPVAWWKVYGVMALLVSPGLFVGVILGLPLLLAGGVGLIFMVIGAMLTFFGATYGMSIYRHGVEMEAL